MSVPSPVRHPWRAALWIGLFTIAVGMAYTMVVMPAIKGWHHKWWVVGEWWPPMMAARYVATGAYPYLYEADRLFVATPLGPIVLAPVAAIGQALRLTDNYRYEVPRPSMWLLYGPYAFALTAALPYAARALADRISLVLPRRSESWATATLWTVSAMFALVVFPAAVVFGHIEDVLALALVLLAISALLGERWTASGLLLGVAVGFKQWAVLGIPLLVALAPSGARARSLRASLLPPVALLAAPLIIDWRHASLALLRPRSFPQLGHAAPWVHHATVPTVGTMFRLGAVVIAVGLAFVIRERRDPAVVLAAFALAFLSRLAFEPVVFAYYLCPALALLFMHERARGWSGLRTVVLGAGWLAFFLLHPRPVLWWMGAITLAASLAWPAVADVWRAVRWPRVDAPRPGAVIQSEVGLQPVP